MKEQTIQEYPPVIESQYQNNKYTKKQIAKVFALMAMKENGFRKGQLTSYKNDLQSEIENMDFQQWENEYDQTIKNL